MNNYLSPTSLLSALSMVLLFTAHAHAQTVMYVDESGNIHHVHSISAVPKRYQAQLTPTEELPIDREMQEALYKEYQRKMLDEMKAEIRGDTAKQAQKEREKLNRQEEKERQRTLRKMEREQRRAEKQQEKELRRRQRIMLQAGVDPRVVFSESLLAEIAAEGSGAQPDTGSSVKVESAEPLSKQAEGLNASSPQE